jgi:tRNA(Phe) wybutosine-synthesizing methylase Tyw3
MTKRETAIENNKKALRSIIKGECDVNHYPLDETYVAGFGVLENNTTRFTIWTKMNKVFFDYGNTYADCEKLDKLFATAKQGGYTEKGINAKREKRFVCDVDTAVQMLTTLFTDAKPKANTKKRSTKKVSNAKKENKTA